MELWHAPYITDGANLLINSPIDFDTTLDLLTAALWQRKGFLDGGKA